MGTLEAVNGLVIVANDADRGLHSKICQRGLFRFVEILIFVDKQVTKFGVLRSTGIVPQIFNKVRDQFADQHGFMKNHPIQQIGLEFLFFGGLGKAWLIALL